MNKTKTRLAKKAKLREKLINIVFASICGHPTDKWEVTVMPDDYNLTNGTTNYHLTKEEIATVITKTEKYIEAKKAYEEKKTNN